MKRQSQRDLSINFRISRTVHYPPLCSMSEANTPQHGMIPANS